MVNAVIAQGQTKPIKQRQALYFTLCELEWRTNGHMLCYVVFNELSHKLDQTINTIMTHIVTIMLSQRYYGSVISICIR